MKLWGSRFSEENEELVEKFNASIGFDHQLYQYDIKGSIAHVKMLAEVDILSKEEAEKIISGLKMVEDDIRAGEVDFSPALEDIHTLIESELINKIGDVGKKLHTARSRNDQVALDIRLYLKDKLKDIDAKLLLLLETLLELAEKYTSVIMPGYTHLQRAQPVNLGHHLMAYYYKFKRDYERWQDNYKRVDILPLGSAALAGTSFPINRELVAEELGFSRICMNSIDGVSDRDFMQEFLSIAASFMMHMSRLSEELILWSTAEYNFIELSDAYSTGSSIMPQKKNPDLAELIRGKTGRVYGHLIQLLTVMKGLPLAYNKDMQEDKEGLFDTVKTITDILVLVPDMLSTMEVKEEIMEAACKNGFLNATELANYLVRKGYTFREAHRITGEAVLEAAEKDSKLEDLPGSYWKQTLPEKGNIKVDELSTLLQPQACVDNNTSVGGSSRQETERIITSEKKWISKK